MKLRTGGHLTYYMPNRQPLIEVTLDGPTPLLEILIRLHIPPAEVDLVAVNGELTRLDEALVNDGDTVHVYPGIDGG